MTISFEEYNKILKEKAELVEMLCKQIEENKKLMKKINKQQNLELENKRLSILVENMQLQLNSLQKMIFGEKREKTPSSDVTEDIVNGTQCTMFENNDLKKIEDDEKFKQELKESREDLMVYRKKHNRTRQAGIKRNIFKNVEIEVEEYILDDSEKCSECGGTLKQIGRKIIHEEIRYVPAKIKIAQHVKVVYKCPNCEKKNGKVEIVEPETPKPLLTHSFVSPSLATEVIYQKYYLGVPLYRQEKMWDDKGLVLPRNMMANWNIKLSQYYLEPLYKLMLKELKTDCELLHCDETKLQCNKEPGRKAHSNSYMWVIASGEQEKKKGIVFTYAQSRSAKTAEKLLKDFKGILVTDAFSSYNNVDCSKQANCFAHARRYFYESVPLDSNKKMITTADGYTGVEYCNKLFEIEREIAKLSVEEKLKVRQEKSKPILDAFFGWVRKTLETKIVTNNKLMKALTYAKNQEKELSEFLTDGRIPLTNSLVERAIRPFAVHRKNWLFADTEAGAKANAIYYSLIESAKVNKLNIYKYIKYLLDELPQIEEAQDEKDIEKYLPWSKELPEEILNYQGTYKEVNLE